MGAAFQSPRVRDALYHGESKQQVISLPTVLHVLQI